MMNWNVAEPANRSRALLKAALLVIFIAAAIALVRFTGVKDYLTAEGLGRFLAAAGLWAPVVYMVIYVLGVCLFVPGAILTGLGAVIFGPYWGFVYVWIGAMIGASAAFFIGRTLGRDFAASLVGDRLRTDRSSRRTSSTRGRCSRRFAPRASRSTRRTPI